MQSNPPSAAAGPRTLLVVDDQPMVRDVVTVMLEMHGFRVLSAADGPAALVLFTREVIDGVLVDMDMPRMNGLELCRALHRIATTLARPFAAWLMTGVPRPELEMSAVAAGARGVLAKPFTTTELLRHVGLLFPDSARPRSAA